LTGRSYIKYDNDMEPELRYRYFFCEGAALNKEGAYTYNFSLEPVCKARVGTDDCESAKEYGLGKTQVATTEGQKKALEYARKNTPTSRAGIWDMYLKCGCNVRN